MSISSREMVKRNLYKTKDFRYLKDFICTISNYRTPWQKGISTIYYSCDIPHYDMYDIHCVHTKFLFVLFSRLSRKE